MAGYFLTDNIFIDIYARHLGIYVVGVYHVLKRHSDSKGYCYPSVDLISARLGMSVSQVKRSIGSLERWGIIKVNRHRGGINRYYLQSASSWNPVSQVVAKDLPCGSDIDLVWPESRVASTVFPDRALTCEWGHSFEQVGYDSFKCEYCGLLKSEDVWKGYKLTEAEAAEVEAINRPFIEYLRETGQMQ